MRAASTRWRLATAAATLALAAFGSGACGSGDDGDGDGDPPETPAAAENGSGGDRETGGDAPSATADERTVIDAYERILDAVANGRPAEACAAMTRETQQELGGGGGDGGGGTCADRFAGVAKAEFNRNRPRILGASVDGDSAFVRVRGRERGGTYRIPFVRENGEWKLSGNI